MSGVGVARRSRPTWRRSAPASRCSAHCRPQHREPLPRAGARTGGYLLAVSGGAGAIVGALQESYERRGIRRSRTLAAIGPAAGALAALNTWVVRRRSHLDSGLPPEEVQASLVKSIAFGVGVAAGMSALGAGERKLADVLSRALARALPGNAAVWRPIAHAATLAGIAVGTQNLAVKALHRIEHVQESAEAAFDFPPPNPLLSGSLESLVPFDTLSRAGRRYVWMTLRAGHDRRSDGRARGGDADTRRTSASRARRPSRSASTSRCASSSARARSIVRG